MTKKKYLLFFPLLFLLVGLLCINISYATGSSQIPVGNVSAIGDLAPGNNITIEVTAVNTYGSAKTRDIGLVLPAGLLNHSPLVIENVVIPSDSFVSVNFSVEILENGDYQLLAYTYEGYGIDQYKIVHLLIGAFPDSLPISIIINETVYIEEIPLDVYADINVTNWLTNNFYPNITVLVNETEYNNIHNTIINNITNTVIVNIVNNFTQWQEQWQWQNQTVIIDIPGGVMWGSLAALGLIGAYNVTAGDTTFKEVRKKRKRKGSDAVEEFAETDFNRRVQYGLALIGAVIGVLIGHFLVYQYVPSYIQANFEAFVNGYASFFFSIFIAMAIFFIILALDEPINLIVLPIIGTLFAMFVDLMWVIVGAILVSLLAVLAIIKRKRTEIQQAISIEEAQFARIKGQIIPDGRSDSILARLFWGSMILPSLVSIFIGLIWGLTVNINGWFAFAIALVYLACLFVGMLSGKALLVALLPIVVVAFGFLFYFVEVTDPSLLIVNIILLIGTIAFIPSALQKEDGRSDDAGTGAIVLFLGVVIAFVGFWIGFTTSNTWLIAVGISGTIIAVIGLWYAIPMDGRADGQSDARYTRVGLILSIISAGVMVGGMIYATIFVVDLLAGIMISLGLISLVIGVMLTITNFLHRHLLAWYSVFIGLTAVFAVLGFTMIEEAFLLFFTMIVIDVLIWLFVFFPDKNRFHPETRRHLEIPDIQGQTLRRLFLISLIGIIVTAGVLILINIIDFLFIAVLVPFIISVLVFGLVTENIIASKKVWIVLSVSGFIVGIGAALIFYFLVLDFIVLIVISALIALESIYIGVTITKMSDDRFWGVIGVSCASLFFIAMVVGGFMYFTGFDVVIAFIVIAVGIAFLFLVAATVIALALLFTRAIEQV